MAYQITCGDLFAGCDFAAQEDSKEVLLQKVAAHASDSHGLTEITPDILAKVESVISEIE